MKESASTLWREPDVIVWAIPLIRERIASEIGLKAAAESRQTVSLWCNLGRTRAHNEDADYSPMKSAYRETFERAVFDESQEEAR